jgi:hypothetical protein
MNADKGMIEADSSFLDRIWDKATYPVKPKRLRRR